MPESRPTSAKWSSTCSSSKYFSRKISEMRSAPQSFAWRANSVDSRVEQWIGSPTTITFFADSFFTVRVANSFSAMISLCLSCE